MEVLCMMDCPLEKKTSKRRKDVLAAGFESVTINIGDYVTKADMEKALEACAEDGLRYVLLPPVCYDAKTETVSLRDKELYLALAPIAQKVGVQILVSNCFGICNGHLVRNEFSDSCKLAAFVDELNQSAAEKTFAICVDTGVCNICRQNPYEFVKGFGDKVSAVLFRTNDGCCDGRCVPFMGAGLHGDSFDWREMVRGLREIGFSGPLIMDYRGQTRRISHLIRRQVDVLAKSVADYLVWQIELEKVIQKYPQRVLFGAGNMCRNYMKCYGEKYPPMFTCDNNSNLWGTEVEGVTVRNPADLKDIPKECAIFICNIYYCEIEKQLRDMGIENPIEYFSDEYMLSYLV